MHTTLGARFHLIPDTWWLMRNLWYPLVNHSKSVWINQLYRVTTFLDTNIVWSKPKKKKKKEKLLKTSRFAVINNIHLT